jgi:spore germination protein YaaH
MPPRALLSLSAGIAVLVLAGCGGGSASDPAPEAVASPRALVKLRNLAASRNASHQEQGASMPELATLGQDALPANSTELNVEPQAAHAMTAQKLVQGKAAPMVLAYYSGYPNNYSALTKYYANFNAASVDFWNITSKGVIVGNGDAAPSNALNFLKSKNIPIYGCISNVDSDWSQPIAHAVTTTYKNAAIANLLAFAKKNAFAGINIDFENVSKNDRANLSNFIATLSNTLHVNGMKLIVSVPAFSSIDEKDDYNWAYDLAALGKSVDYLQIMTYDETILDWSPGPVAGSDWMENALDYAVARVSPAKILNGIPAYGYDWPAPKKEGQQGGQLYWAATPALLSQYNIKPRYDTGSNSLTFTYTAKDGSGLHTVWTENAASVSLKAGLVNAYGLGGTSLYALGMEDASFWKAVNAGLQQ